MFSVIMIVVNYDLLCSLLAKLTVTDELKMNNLTLPLSGMDGPLLRYMQVFRIMQNVQDKFVSGILHVLRF